MPRGDGTGPAGAGPRTGRSTGYCAGYSSPGFANGSHTGCGYGRAGGRGRGFRNRCRETGVPGRARSFAGAYNPPVFGMPGGMTAEQETEVLRNRARAMQEGLQTLEARIHDLEKGATEKEKK